MRLHELDARGAVVGLRTRQLLDELDLRRRVVVFD